MNQDLVRFLKKVQVRDAGYTTPCIEWIGYRDKDGYGIFRAGKMVRAHRWIWEQLVGPIPIGLEIDHQCKNRACVKCDHLRIVIPIQNHPQFESMTCPNGHSYEGCYIYPDGPNKGKRKCRICRRISEKKLRNRIAI